MNFVDVKLQIPTFERLLDVLEALEGPLALARLRGQFLGAVDAKVALGSVVILRLGLLLLHPDDRPLTLALRACAQLLTLINEAFVRLFGQAQGVRPLIHVARPAPGVLGARARMFVDLKDRSHRAFKELAIVRDHDESTLSVVDPLLEARETLEVKVVSRFVEQHDVEARQFHPGQGHLGFLSARQAQRRSVNHLGHAQLSEDRLGARVKGGRADRLKVREGVVVAVAGVGSVEREFVGGVTKSVIGTRHPGAARESGPHTLVGMSLMLLGEIPDARARWF